MHEENTILDTLSLNAKERGQLLRSMNQLAAKPSAVPCRRRLRVAFDSAPPVVMKIIDANGNDLRYTCQPRNLSRWGVAVIHGRFIYPESVCLIALPTLDRQYTAHQAIVRQCRHIKGTVHEVSLVFSEPIVLNNYVELSDDEQAVARHESKEDADAMDRGQ